MKIFANVFTIVVLAMFLSVTAYCDNAERTATIVENEGANQVSSDGTNWIPAEVGMVLHQGDVIRTADNSFLVMNLEGEESATVELKEKGELRLSELLQDKTAGTQKTLLDLALGEILITSKKLRAEESKFEVKTPTSIVGVRGTTFSVAVEEEQ